MSGCKDDQADAAEDADAHAEGDDPEEERVDWGSRCVTDRPSADRDVGEDASANIDALEAELREHGLFGWLDLEIETVEPGRVVFMLPFNDKFANLTSRTVHGGITATIIDTASGFALRSTFDDPAAAQITTTDLNVRYVRPARGDIRVKAEVVRAGGSMGVTDCEVTTVHEGERKVVATGGTSYRLFRE